MTPLPCFSLSSFHSLSRAIDDQIFFTYEDGRSALASLELTGKEVNNVRNSSMLSAAISWMFSLNEVSDCEQNSFQNIFKTDSFSINL